MRKFGKHDVKFGLSLKIANDRLAFCRLSRMNLMDMLSSDGPDIYQQDDMMGSLLEEQIPAAQSTAEAIIQPENGVYFFPACLSKIQRELMECIVNVCAPELAQDIYVKRQRSKIHSLLDSDESESGLGKKSLSYEEKIAILFEQLQIVTKHPSLLVDHFLPKKLLLADVNERLVAMSGKFHVFNGLIDSLTERFRKEAKFEEPQVYNILVVAESVKELELVEGLIIGKDLQYANVSSRKLYDDNRPLTGAKKIQIQQGSQELEDGEEKSRKRQRHNFSSSPKTKPELCLYLIRSAQLVNQFIPALSDGSLQPRLIFSFDNEIDLESPNLDMLRSGSTNTHFFDRNPFKTPIVMPVPLYSIEHIMIQHPKPRTDFASEDVTKWKEQLVSIILVNRDNLFDEGYTEFLSSLYGNKFSKLIDWLLNWDSVEFPQIVSEVLQKANDKVITNFTEEKLAKKLEMKYLPRLLEGEINGEVKEEGHTVESFDYKSFKAKLSHVVHNRLKSIDQKVLDLYDTIIPKFRVSETERQVRLDQEEEEVARNYQKLRKLNDEANVVERAYGRVDAELAKYQDQKADLVNKLDHLKRLADDREMNVEEKQRDQEALLQELEKDQGDLIKEHDKLVAENEAIRLKYQESSSEAVKLTVQIGKLIEQNNKMETRLGGPGIKILPSLIRKDDLINHDTTLKKVTSENQFLRKFFEERLDKLIKERQGLLEHTSAGSTSRPTNRISRGSTPF